MNYQKIKEQLKANKIVTLRDYTIYPLSEMICWDKETKSTYKSMMHSIHLSRCQTKYYDDEVKFNKAIKRVLRIIK